MNRNRRILVTGGGGFVGSVLTRLLISRGYEVAVADDLSAPHSRVDPESDFHEVDAGNPDALGVAFRGADACIALASRPGAIGFVSRNPTDILTGNNRIYHGTFEAAATARIKRLVFVSSSMVFERARQFPTAETHIAETGVPISDFGLSKLMGEHFCRAFGKARSVPFTIVRPSNVYGTDELPGEKIGDSHVIPDLFAKLRSGQRRLEILGDGNQTRCFVHKRDIAEGIVAALESERAENEDFNVGGAEEITIRDLAGMIWDHCGTGEPLELAYLPAFPQDVQRQCMDCSKAREVLGWAPRIPFAEGLAEVLDWLSANAETPVKAGTKSGSHSKSGHA